MNDLVIQKLKAIRTEEELHTAIPDLATELLLINQRDMPANYRALRAKAKLFGVEKSVSDTIKAIFAQNGDKKLLCSIEEEVFPYIHTEVNEKTNKVRHRLCCPELAQYIRQNSHYIFVRNEACDSVRRFWYRDGCYRLITDEELKSFIKMHITDFDLSILRMRDVAEVFSDLITDNRFVSENDLNTDENIINFQNGLLCLDTLELKPHTPDMLSTIQLPCRWNPDAHESPVFDRFLDDFTGSDHEKKEFLLQYMGTALSNIRGYRMKKSLFMFGEGNTGKSQLKMLTERLLGRENTSPADLNDLEARFGLAKVYGKRLVGASDMSCASVSELKLFKQLTGGDEISIERKCKESFSYRYYGLMWFCTNRLPEFGGDRGKWVYDRIIPLRCSNSVPEEKQDKFLCEKMYQEREAIVYKAVLRAKRVTKNGYRFDIPRESERLLGVYRKENSPVVRFYEECCTARPDGKIRDKCTTRIVHEVFAKWCRVNAGAGFAMNVPQFKSELAQYLETDESSLLKKLHGSAYYIFTLSDETKKEYHIYDSIAEGE